jgi:spermidine/putrescine transport system ATP-binding protein
MILSDQSSDGESLKGTVTENIFIGTDITTLVDLDGGPKITIRTSNTERGNKRLIEPGNPAFVTMEAGAARLLVD